MVSDAGVKLWILPPTRAIRWVDKNVVVPHTPHIIRGISPRKGYQFLILSKNTSFARVVLAKRCVVFLEQLDLVEQNNLETEEAGLYLNSF